jgi:hypothetical protein
MPQHMLTDDEILEIAKRKRIAELLGYQIISLRRLRDSLEKNSASSSFYAKRLEKFTIWLISLTVILIGIGLVQILLIIFPYICN